MTSLGGAVWAETLSRVSSRKRSALYAGTITATGTRCPTDTTVTSHSRSGFPSVCPRIGETQAVHENFTTSNGMRRGQRRLETRSLRHLAIAALVRGE